MILAAHQPNFLPYMGYFYKMYCCDVFSFSDEVQFARKEFQNYNFISEDGRRSKLTVPVRGHAIPYNEVELSEWKHHRRKLLARIETAYRGYPFYSDLMPTLRWIFNQNYNYLVELNMALLTFITDYMRMPCKFIRESNLDIEYVEPNIDIATICQDTGCGRYLSGSGAEKYLNKDIFNQCGIQLLWSGYQPIDYGSEIENGSVLDYLMLCGRTIPEQWRVDREAMHSGV